MDQLTGEGAAVMPMCPACHTEQSKRIKGSCPNCETPVSLYKGFWFRTSLGSPNEALLRHFEKLVSAQLSRGGIQANFTVPRKNKMRYSRELATAERLLDVAGYDFGLATATLELLFTDKRFSWKTKDSLLWIERDYSTAITIMQALRNYEQQKKRKEQALVQNILAKEDVFSNK